MKKIVEKIQVTLNKPMTIDLDIYSVGSSIGIDIFLEDGRSFDTLVKDSDEATYSIKNNGKDDYKFI